MSAQHGTTKTKTEVFFAEYEEFLTLRDTTNNGIMALNVGAKLSAHFLQLTAGSPHTLKSLFPGVEHVGTFNLRTEVALAELNRAESLLTSMAIPFHLAHLERYCSKVSAVLSKELHAPKLRRATKRQIKEDKYLATVSQYLDAPLPPEITKVVALLKSIRDDFMHVEGKADINYATEYAEAIQHCLDYWGLKSAGNLHTLMKGDRIALTMADMLLALAVVKRAAREINFALQDSLPREFWAKLLVRDFRATRGLTPLNDEQSLKKCRGFATVKYSSLKLTIDEIEKALKTK